MMELDEAIKHCHEKAEEMHDREIYTDTDGIECMDYECNQCAKEHEQLAEWLKDYKRLLAERGAGAERPTGEWIPVTYRPMTEEEEKEFCENLGIKEGSLEDWEKKVFTCHLPDDGQEILVSHGKYVCEDICEWDEYGCGLENNGDWCGITAWMPKPKPYKEEAENEQ